MKKQSIMFGLLVSILCAFQLVSSVHASEPIQVVVSIPPQTYFVKQIGGDLVDVISMLPEGGFPHTYEPTPKQMTSLSKADLYVRIRVEFENAWWEKMLATNPDMYVVDSTAGVEFIEAEAHHHEGEEHEHDAEHHEKESESHHHDEETHAHHGLDPHIWLSPRMVKIQAEAICEGLIRMDPKNKEIYLAKKDAFIKVLDALDGEIRKTLANLTTRKFMVFHPSWAYFARDYNLEQIPIEIEGKEPSVQEMKNLMNLAKDEHITVIFVQPQTSRRSAETIATQIGAKVEILDPLAANWLENMQRVSRVLAETLSK